jgi:hypothetical protein
MSQYEADWKAGYVKNQKYEAISEGFVVDEPVNGKPVSGCKFPASREFAGNFSVLWRNRHRNF